MSKKMLAGLLVVIVVGMLIWLNIAANNTSVEDALNKANTQNVRVLDSINTEHGQVVFFSSKDIIEVALLRHGLSGWKIVDRIGRESLSNSDGLAWNFTNLDVNGSRPIHLFWGIVNNPQITQVEVQTSSEPLQEAKMINAKGARISYILYDQDQRPPAKIIGLSNDGNKIYEY